MKRKKELLVVLTSLLVIVLSVTVAYFTVQIIGEGKELSVSTANLQIIYEDTDGSISGSNIIPPWSSSKTFKVSNSSNATYEYDIIIEDLVNTFVLDYLEYKITSSNGYNMTEYKPVPKSASATNTVLAHSISIDEDEIHNYTIEFRYQDADTDQSEDMGKTLTGRIMISEGTTEPGPFIDKLLADNTTRYTVGEEGSPRQNFDIELDWGVEGSGGYVEENTNTLFTTTATEDGSSVYYFSGNPTNNWVRFGKEIGGTCTYNGVAIEEYYHFERNNIYKEANCEKITKMCYANSKYYYDVTSSSTCTNKLGGELVEGTPIWTEIDEGVDIYWRIIRTNEDGSVRLLYHGNSTTSQDAHIGIQEYGIEYNSASSSDPLYVGYMYGTTGSLLNNRTNQTNSSKAKQTIDSWYANSLNVKTDRTYTYDKYVSKTAIYCNDRSTNGTYSLTSVFNFGAYNRINAGSPSYKCGADLTGTLYNDASNTDKFSVSTSSGGNGELTYPIALMTVDEIVFAGSASVNLEEVIAYGAFHNTNSSGNTSTIDSWYTMSPGEDGNSLYAVLDANNELYRVDYYNLYAIRPVLSLKACATWAKGDGSATSPYEVSIDATCAAAEN